MGYADCYVENSILFIKSNHKTLTTPNWLMLERAIGPNNPSFVGVLQPIADAVKLCK